MFFLICYDDNPDKTAVEKIQAAIATYVERFTRHPALVLVNAVDFTEIVGFHVYRDRRVLPNTFWVGDEHNGSSGSATMDSSRCQAYASS